MVKHDHTDDPQPAPQSTRQVRGTVVAVIPEYQQVKIRSDDGSIYSITEHTQGIRLNTLREGQHVQCTVTVRLPRVLLAQVVA